VWKTTDAIASDTGIRLYPTCTFETCPSNLDILFVPGGFGGQNFMADAEVLGFLATRAATSKYITSVCSGSLLLGAAGLLKGYEATSHWAVRDALAGFGAKPVDARVVVDRNRITGGGVTAGIDFGLTILAKLRGDGAAKLTQLAMEYDPQPPFDCGSPKTAGPSVIEDAQNAMSAQLERLAS